jgi:hypothetical protein
VDGRDEADCPATDRALAVLAVRIAAADVLARTGRSVPLVLETHRELLQAVATRDRNSDPAYRDVYGATYHDRYRDGHGNHPIAAALQDFVRAGRQVVLLTSSDTLAKQIRRDGGRCFELFTNRTVHPHRPIWRPQYAAEHYVGPHPHTYGTESAPDPQAQRPQTQRRYHPGSVPRNGQLGGRTNGSPAPVVRGVDDVNRNFDMAWREAYGLYDNPEGYHSVPETDWAPVGTDYRDGYYVADSFTTAQPAASTFPSDHGQPAEASASMQLSSRPVDKRSPFFLSVDSPIDQAPSIDAIAAARLRGLKVTHINHLMQQDSNRLADALGLSNVDAATIRRWQSECRLCCRVPQLRGFDSRVLVGCGITEPGQLASIHPTDLLEHVEGFLATDAGQRILRTGSSHELSRITSWIASARSNNPTKTAAAARVVNGRVVGRTQPQTEPQQEPPYGFDSDRYEYELAEDCDTGQENSRAAGRSRLGPLNGRRYGIKANSRNSRGPAIDGTAANGKPASRTAGKTASEGSERSSRSRRAARRRDVVRMEREPRGSNRRGNREGRRRSRVQRDVRSRVEQSQGSERVAGDTADELRFYLQRESPIVDAPSIGDRMTKRLNAVGVYTVDDLINADPETLAAELGHRRIDADTIAAWQQQATLVCRIPMLRGHDAQLLVAAEITTAEEVAASDADELFSLIDPISRSSEGKRIIRGGKLPDLNEIKDWIGFAQQNRDLMAA